MICQALIILSGYAYTIDCLIGLFLKCHFIKRNAISVIIMQQLVSKKNCD